MYFILNKTSPRTFVYKTFSDNWRLFRSVGFLSATRGMSLACCTVCWDALHWNSIICRSVRWRNCNRQGICWSSFFWDFSAKVKVHRSLKYITQWRSRSIILIIVCTSCFVREAVSDNMKDLHWVNRCSSRSCHYSTDAVRDEILSENYPPFSEFLRLCLPLLLCIYVVLPVILSFSHRSASLSFTAIL